MVTQSVERIVVPNLAHATATNIHLVRLVLNFKDLPYTTEWTEYPDLEPTLSGLGVKPNDPSSAMASYTAPTVKLPDGTFIMDSWPIVQHLEKENPTPSLHLDSPYLKKIQDLMPKLMPTLSPIYLPAVPRLLLNDKSAKYFRETREKRVGMPLDEFEKSDKGGPAAFKAAKPYLEEVVAMLKENESGPFFMGKEPSYADFVFVGAVRMFERIDRLGEFMRSVDGEDVKYLANQFEACEQWLLRDDR